MRNDISSVRNLLIEGMERLLNPEEGDSFDIDKAKAMAELGDVVVKSAIAEVHFLKVANQAGARVQPTGFFQNTNKALNE